MTFEISAATAPTDDSLELVPLIEEPETEEPFDPLLISQTILKLGKPTGVYSSSPFEVSTLETASVPVASTQVLEAMQRLMKVITDLRSPESGLPPDIPRTPETLAPYLVEEAYDVLEAVQKNYAEPPQSASLDLGGGGGDLEEITARGRQSYFLISDLAPWLLWCIARSSHEVMRLLEGVPAKAFKLGQGWRTGIIRLVAMLETKIPGLSTSVDLATYQVNRSLLPSDTMIQSDEYSACQQPTWIAGFLPHLMQQIEAATPSVNRFFAGVEVDALAPNCNWQSGLLQLQLGFEFTATDATVFPDFAEVSVEGEGGAIAPDSPAIANPAATLIEEAPSTSPPSNSPPPQIKFTDLGWREKYSTALLQQQIASTVQQLPTFRAAGEKNRNLSSQSLIPQIVRDACDLIDLLQKSPTPSSQTFLQQGGELAALTHQLLWSFSRSAYEVMQLMGGIRVNLLQPECTWETGTLRLLASINSKTPEQDWQLDITTGQPPQPHIFPLAHNVIVQSYESHWCARPNVLEQLEAKLMQQLDQVAPDLLLFMAGTDVEISGDNQQWQSGAMQLNVGFEFIPDLNYSNLG